MMERLGELIARAAAIRDNCPPHIDHDITRIAVEVTRCERDENSIEAASNRVEARGTN